MPRINQLTELSDRTLNRVTSSRAEWISYLTAVGRMYKYNPRDQLLIYAQRPDATACADIPTWNSLHRVVNRGAKSIALINSSGDSLRINNVFDISDTYAFQGAPEINLWSLVQRHYGTVVTALVDHYDLSDEAKRPIADSLDSTCKAAVTENFVSGDYITDFLDSRNDSLFSELDEHSAEVFFRETVIDSVYTCVMSRCGLLQNALPDTDFQHLTDFSARSVKIRLCEAVSNISESILRDIERIVKRIQKEERKNNYGREEKLRGADLLILPSPANCLICGSTKNLHVVGNRTGKYICDSCFKQKK